MIRIDFPSHGVAFATGAARAQTGQEKFSFRPPSIPTAAKAQPEPQAEAEAAGLSEGRLPSPSGSTRSGEKLAAGREHCGAPPFPGGRKEISAGHDGGTPFQSDLFNNIQLDRSA
jgi:hypothetical protein